MFNDWLSDNLAFEKELKTSREEMGLPPLLSLGTCGLHTVHRAFQTGAKATNWNLDRYCNVRVIVTL